MEQMTFAFLGLGLIGGSIAKAIRTAYPGCFIRACDTDPATLKLALAEGTADEVTDHIGEDNGASFTSCDFLFLCAPRLPE